MAEPKVYCTSFCNHGHRLADGVPVDHQCFVLHPESLRLEREGRYSEIEKMHVGKIHRGVKSSQEE